ncbi:MAG: peptidoglycan-binding domain-containing protein [Tropicimonas sp.]|uniref:peptidoglycan-binding domain-containing protein n=1 Tax=Tropicimonas sp. TaxID=2067044 RepID=UPI003A872A09
MRRAVLALSISAIAVAGTPPQQARADAGDAIAGAIVGGIIGNAIGREQARKKAAATPRRSYSTRSSVSSAQRAENRSVQHALNYFGFSAGGADGVLGRNSRAAISSYQAQLGYPATGQLTQYERDFLLTSHNRALAGGAATNQMIAANPMGARGLLLNYRDQAAGMAPAQAAPGAPMGSYAVAPQAAVPAVPAEPVPVVQEADAGPQMPSFLGATQGRSLASHCNAVNLMTNARGGFATYETMTDPQMALDEQFCLARTYAIAQSEMLASQVQGATPAEISAQCKQLAPLLKDQIAAVSVSNRQAVIDGTSAFVLSTGMAPAQAAQTARICLGDGYRIDDMDVVLSSALILVSLGEPVYGELLGHHLAEGFGTTKRGDLAYDWYQASSDALARGATPVFAPEQAGRAELILTAASELRSGGGAPVTPKTQPASATGGMPSFSLQQ